MYLPEKIERMIGKKIYNLDTVGMSKATVLCFDDVVLKVEARSIETNNEHNMLVWLSDKLPVPKVLCHVEEDKISYLLMSKADGEMTSSQNMLNNPKNLIKVVADGLKMMWKINVKSNVDLLTTEKKLEFAEYLVSNDLCDMVNVEPETYGENGFKNPEELLRWLKDNKPKEDIVFSHGDFCLPNIFAMDSKLSGLIDFGRSGVADKYQDIALCCRSLKHNMERKHKKLGSNLRNFDINTLFDELEINPDFDKIKYYSLLDELF